MGAKPSDAGPVPAYRSTIPFHPALGEELSVQLEKLRLAELLDPFFTDVAHYVVLRVVLPVLPRGSLVSRVSVNVLCPNHFDI